MSEQKKERRVCIVGTAPTWKLVPWDDPTLEIWALNDMSVLNLPRADAWYDLHPFDKMYFRSGSKQVFAGDVPAGYFVRPEGHIEWLKQQTIPVYVQDASLLGSPSARTFPKAEIEARFGKTFASSPAWMIAHALYEGVTELHIYGIHLATEWEYTKQKPNMLFLLGIAAAMGVKIVTPKGCPLLVESHQYAYEDDPDLPKVALKRKQLRIQDELASMMAREKGRKWYQRRDPNYAARTALLKAQLADCSLAIQHVICSRAPVGY
jgi:hypothetical protein